MVIQTQHICKIQVVCINGRITFMTDYIRDHYAFPG